MLSSAPGQKAKTLESWTQALRQRSQPCSRAAVARTPLICSSLSPHPPGTGGGRGREAEDRGLGTHRSAQRLLKQKRATSRPKDSTSSSEVDPCPTVSWPHRDRRDANISSGMSSGQAGEGSAQGPSQWLQGPDRPLGPGQSGSQGDRGHSAHPDREPAGQLLPRWAPWELPKGPPALDRPQVPERHPGRHTPRHPAP